MKALRPGRAAVSDENPAAVRPTEEWVGGKIEIPPSPRNLTPLKIGERASGVWGESSPTTRDPGIVQEPRVA